MSVEFIALYLRHGAVVDYLYYCTFLLNEIEHTTFLTATKLSSEGVFFSVD